MAWFVAYEFKRRDGSEWHKSNVILRTTHPVIWISNPPEVFDKGLINHLSFFEEISDEIVEFVAQTNWCGIEE